jgi:hypothetical protein
MEQNIPNENSSLKDENIMKDSERNIIYINELNNQSHHSSSSSDEDKPNKTIKTFRTKNVESDINKYEDREINKSILSQKSKKKKTCCNKFSEVFKILKQMVYIFLMIICSFCNFSYSNIPFTIFGALLISLLFIKMRCIIKAITVIYILTFTYACILLLSKFTLGMGYLGNTINLYSFVIDNKDLLINLGLSFLENDGVTAWVLTYLPESILILSYLILQIFRRSTENDLEIFLLKLKGRKKYIFFILIILTGMCNSIISSFISFIYGGVFLISLLFWSFNKHKYILSALYAVLIVISTLYLIIFHYFNFYFYRQSLNDLDDYRMKWLGVLNMNKEIYVRIKYIFLKIVLCRICTKCIDLYSVLSCSKDKKQKT